MLDLLAEAAVAVAENRRLIVEGRKTLTYMRRVCCEMHVAANEAKRAVEDAERINVMVACGAAPEV